MAEERVVEIFTGNGKGKTTAALGTVLRAAGQGLRVHIVQFMKGTYPYGEHQALAQLPNVTVARFGHLDFVDPQNIRDEEREEAERALMAGRKAIFSGGYDLVVLDEVNIAAAWGLVELDEVIRLIREKPGDVELILTGRYADPRLIDLADLVTEMVEVKHPYQKGVKPRRGFEY
ncbi:cob(I)yrinic acid a,c-diamide adenosyltransferase [Dehalococcoidia bacterium]|nr:cob(I)yrinic acid a,c-diamide adenosyltransferase [Dehalococcoidia bacterium]MCL0070180.1 cob(I)yrinic acid a,c-diamide adenosyltransferase [Dehalococcoidia bacterium]